MGSSSSVQITLCHLMLEYETECRLSPNFVFLCLWKVPLWKFPRLLRFYFWPAPSLKRQIKNYSQSEKKCFDSGTFYSIPAFACCTCAPFPTFYGIIFGFVLDSTILLADGFGLTYILRSGRFLDPFVAP